MSGRRPGPREAHGSHPTQKPLMLVRRVLLDCTRERDLIFDPFCGSGTTAVASKELNRFFVEAEMEAELAERPQSAGASCVNSPSSAQKTLFSVGMTACVRQIIERYRNPHRPRAAQGLLLFLLVR